MPRNKPEDSDKYCWDKFELWADEWGDGMEDWEFNWDCWKAAIEAFIGID